LSPLGGILVALPRHRHLATSHTAMAATGFKARLAIMG
jgi:hypothetical protein